MQAVKRDDQRLGNGRNVPGNIGRQRNQHVRRMAEILGHTAINMHTQTLEICAAIGSAQAARIAVAAVYIGVDHDPVPRLNSCRVVRRNLFYNTGQLMTNDAGIANQSIGSPVCADIASANAGADNANQGLPGPRLRLGNVNANCFPGLLK